MADSSAAHPPRARAPRSEKEALAEPLGCGRVSDRSAEPARAGANSGLAKPVPYSSAEEEGGVLALHASPAAFGTGNKLAVQETSPRPETRRAGAGASGRTASVLEGMTVE